MVVVRNIKMLVIKIGWVIMATVVYSVTDGGKAIQFVLVEILPMIKKWSALIFLGWLFHHLFSFHLLSHVQQFTQQLFIFLFDNLPFTLNLESAKFLRTSYFTLFVHILLCLFAINLTIIIKREKITCNDKRNMVTVCSFLLMEEEKKEMDW